MLNFNILNNLLYSDDSKNILNNHFVEYTVYLDQLKQDKCKAYLLWEVVCYDNGIFKQNFNFAFV